MDALFSRWHTLLAVAKIPPVKKQKTGEDAGAQTKEQELESATPHKNDESKDDKPNTRDIKSIPDYEYVCMHRPHFTYEVENRKAEEPLDEDEVDDKYSEDFQKNLKSGIILQPAKDHPEWKWTILWAGFKNFSDYRRRSKYCDPDNFSMHIFNDFHGWGLQELMENQILEFDAALKKTGNDALKQMWAPISALALWLNEVDQGPFIGNEDGEKVGALCDLMGTALLRALAALDHADEIKADTSFIDIPLVISSFLEWSNDLPAYGIEDENVAWRPHAAAYFTKGKFTTDKAVPGTTELVQDAEPTAQNELPKKTVKDPWKWSKRLKDYKSHHGSPGIGGSKYDITKMSRKERAAHAFDGKDPLKDIPEKDLKEGNLDFD
ncbi:hypothetical protein BDU57DRAFT_548681 [Ampelomyces quisqualis]|uniref:Uncharacterized protein n=1 Tax=Ampelomyces quisqualis TaxID=50730 RepID=A0A6A5QQN5_AMPQU|nr:hypothetical protein BDU57DRAFT_548681 [Ampelomyces quisqualis]